MKTRYSSHSLFPIRYLKVQIESLLVHTTTLRSSLTDGTILTFSFLSTLLACRSQMKITQILNFCPYDQQQSALLGTRSSNSFTNRNSVSSIRFKHKYSTPFFTQTSTSLLAPQPAQEKQLWLSLQCCAYLSKRLKRKSSILRRSKRQQKKGSWIGR